MTQSLGSGGASLVAQMVKNLPAMQKTQVQSLGWEDPPEKRMATHSSMYACLENRMDRGSVNSWEKNYRKGMEWKPISVMKSFQAKMTRNP